MLSKVKATVLTLDVIERFEKAANNKNYMEMFELLTNPDYRDLFVLYLSRRDDGPSLIEDTLSYEMDPETVFPVLSSIARYFGNFQKFRKLIRSVTETVLPKMSSHHVVLFLLKYGDEILDVLKQEDLIFEGVLDKVADYFEQIRGKIETEELSKGEREEARKQLKEIVELTKKIGKPLPQRFVSITGYFLIEIPESLYSKPEPTEDIVLLAQEFFDFLSKIADFVPKYRQELYSLASQFKVLIGESEGKVEEQVLRKKFNEIVEKTSSIIKEIVVNVLLQYLCDAFFEKDIPPQYPKPSDYLTTFKDTYLFLSKIVTVDCSFDEKDQYPIVITVTLGNISYRESFSSNTIDSFLYWLIEIAASFRRKLSSEVRERIYRDYYEFLEKTNPDLAAEGIPLVDLGGYQETIGITSATKIYKDVKNRILELLKSGVRPTEMSFYDLQLTLSPAVLFTVVNWLEKDKDVIQAIGAVGGSIEKLRELIIGDYKNYLKKIFKEERAQK